MDKKPIALGFVAVVLLASGCVSSITNPLCNNECRETTVVFDGDIGEVSTIDINSCNPRFNEECRILDAHWNNIESHSMRGIYFVHCECCRIVET